MVANVGFHGFHNTGGVLKMHAGGHVLRGDLVGLNLGIPRVEPHGGLVGGHERFVDQDV